MAVAFDERYFLCKPELICNETEEEVFSIYGSRDTIVNLKNKRYHLMQRLKSRFPSVSIHESANDDMDT